MGVRVPVGLDARDDALVILGAGFRRQLTFEPDLDARPVLAEPRLGLERPLRGQQLEHLARPAQRLTDGAPSVDQVRRHRFGTS